MKTIWEQSREFFANAFDTLGLAWWIEIVTQNPKCTYYFGPFLSSTEAKAAVKGYVEDLEQEGAQGIAIDVKRCKPEVLTIAEDLGELTDRKVQPVFSGQV
ncbi:DUF1816 domain-containing protein [Mastigocladus laminosus UU774]|nr:MAG: DUF1816 domain-containing protein [Hapalosiphonaceae cyanobacterium JJU2]TBR61704.1 hypothetical protein B4U84_13260 [Westiellopsis prolifica IICB1]TFI55920.1 DUF1816 domain-containing protein [Mastigocladus laminosus UU774]